MLIRSVKRPDGLRFEVSKEGLLKLKQFHNKKVLSGVKTAKDNIQRFPSSRRYLLVQ